jgi:hypothetical protein
MFWYEYVCSGMSFECMYVYAHVLAYMSDLCDLANLVVDVCAVSKVGMRGGCPCGKGTVYACEMYAHDMRC